MKKVSVALLLFLCIFGLIGCGGKDTPISGATQTLEILLTDTDVLSVEIPVELVVSKRDNQHYWEFNNGVGIYRMTSTQSTASYDEEHDLYIGNSSVIRNFDTCCVVVNCSGNLKDYFIEALSKATISKKDALPYVEYQIESLPKYTEAADMELIGNMYMPPNCEDVLYDIYDSKLYTQGADWLQSMIIDAKLDDLRPRLLTLALLNSGEERISGWYESDEIFYCYTDTCIVGAKKLAFNSWYVYYGSPSMVNYIRTGIEKVHADSK